MHDGALAEVSGGRFQAVVGEGVAVAPVSRSSEAETTNSHAFLILILTLFLCRVLDEAVICVCVSVKLSFCRVKQRKIVEDFEEWKAAAAVVVVEEEDEDDDVLIYTLLHRATKVLPYLFCSSEIKSQAMSLWCLLKIIQECKVVVVGVRTFLPPLITSRRRYVFRSPPVSVLSLYQRALQVSAILTQLSYAGCGFL
ncbi:uncharacterized protein G2W53_041958 [Senna tora]|uniref:Uncharacterized protein n=1 Tax=Senna tora TaxID=362788 RepID=A0A834SKT4_9FABA|nr:uncharacterized protein G2W53_041958 [Senna tora]